MAETKPHTRVNDILLGPLERPALQWLAAHMPAWMTPDILTAIGTAGAIIILISYWLSNLHPAFLWLASAGLVINWFGDSLDGTLARYRKIERPQYGFFIDHTVDAFNEMLIVLGIGLSPFVRFDIAAVALVGYLLMSVYVYVRTYVDGVFKISYGKLGPTELRVLIIALNALMFIMGAPQVSLGFATVSIYDLLVGAIALILILLFVWSSLRKAQELAKLDARPRPPKP